jgi:hypothetical protein
LFPLPALFTQLAQVVQGVQALAMTELAAVQPLQALAFIASSQRVASPLHRLLLLRLAQGQVENLHTVVAWAQLLLVRLQVTPVVVVAQAQMAMAALVLTPV